MLTKEELDVLYEFIEIKGLDCEVSKEVIVHNILNYSSVSISFKNMLVDELINFDEDCESDNNFALLIKLNDLLDFIIEELVCR